MLSERRKKNAMSDFAGKKSGNIFSATHFFYTVRQREVSGDSPMWRPVKESAERMGAAFRPNELLIGIRAR